MKGLFVILGIGALLFYITVFTLMLIRIDTLCLIIIALLVIYAYL